MVATSGTLRREIANNESAPHAACRAQFRVPCLYYIQLLTHVSENHSFTLHNLIRLSVSFDPIKYVHAQLNFTQRFAKYV
jgi:hypothetical protein